MPSSNWWDKRLGVPTAPGPRKAAQWETNYPPVRQPEPPQPEYDPGLSQEDREALDRQQRVRTQGYVSKAPEGKGASSHCPGCGGSNLFRRRWAGKECAPLCTDCGYNGDYFTQSGVLLNGVGFHSSGPTESARMTNPDGKSTFGADQQLVNAGWNPGSVR
jgi:hypothetical protein